MPLLKAAKKKRAQEYVKNLDEAVTIVVIRHDAIPVNEINAVRMDIADASGRMQAIKKRVFLKGLEGKYEGVTLEDMQGSIAILYAYSEEDVYGPLKVINKYKNKWKKEKKEYGFEYVGGRVEKEWKDKGYITTLATLPSKEELVGKFLFLLNHPMSSFARALQAVGDKKASEVSE